ncbi:hypothetical protein LBMAG53_18650 [Planctomycetota bacterium]|nr:hypothetical protein LBMAG53_18650 [Planctomycetota bacterium]
MHSAAQIIKWLTIAIAVVASCYLLFRVSGSGLQANQVTITATVERIEAVGRLVVLQAVLKEIVTTQIVKDNDKSWEYSKPKKAAFIFTFSIDFSYDLKSGPLKIDNDGSGNVTIFMPPVDISYNIKEFKIYDKQPGIWLGVEYPLTVSEENDLYKEAKDKCAEQAREFVATYKAQYENSAETTLKLITEAFGCKSVKLVFSDRKNEKLQ